MTDTIATRKQIECDWEDIEMPDDFWSSDVFDPDPNTTRRTPWDADNPPRKLRSDLTPIELFRLEEYGSIHFESAGARRQK